MKIYFFVYRKWAFKIANTIRKKFYSDDVKIFSTKINELSRSEIRDNNVIILSNTSDRIIKNYLKKKPQIIFYIGWSEIISKKIYQNFLCICLHPSKLPLFRGGSPIQHQIIRNINKSAITLFKLNRFIDGGPISHQTNLSLNGDIPVIFKRIEKKGYLLVLKFINDFKKKKIVFKKQNLSNYKIFKRRNLSQSNLNFDTLINKKFIYFNNFVRMLTGPYPAACIYKKKWKIKIFKIKKTKSQGPLLKKNNISKIINANGYIIKLKDCKVKILKSIIFKN